MPQTVFVDTRSLATAPAGEGRPHLVPDADHALRTLREAGHRVVLLANGDAPAVRDALGEWPESIDGDIPADAEGWLISDDRETCGQARRLRRVRTILVGPALSIRGPERRPADIQARGLSDAALAILTAEAMPAAPARRDSRSEREARLRRQALEDPASGAP